MIKKQLGLLAGSVMIAATSNAAITLGSNTLAVFNTVGAGSYYQLIGGSSASSLIGGIGFSIDISTAAAALGGTWDSFALLALKEGQCTPTLSPCYNYSEYLYVSEGGGLVYTTESPTPMTNVAATNQISYLQSILAGASLGFNAEGSFGDFDSYAYAAGFLHSRGTWPDTSSLFLVGEGWFDDASEYIHYPLFFNQQTLTDSTNLCPLLSANTSSCLAASPIPIPTTAWLFGSALAGLLVARGKNKK